MVFQFKKIGILKKIWIKTYLKDEMWNSNKNGGMELKNQILEMDALSKLQEKFGIQKIQK